MMKRTLDLGHDHVELPVGGEDDAHSIGYDSAGETIGARPTAASIGIRGYISGFKWAGFLLVLFTFGCDRAHADTPAEAEVCERVSAPGSTILDHALCVAGSSTIAACGTTDARLRPCDADWVDHCNTVGARVTEVRHEQSELVWFLDQTVTCSDTSPLMRPCDEEFRGACDTLGFTFIGMSTAQGQCTPLRSCSAGAKCPNGTSLSCKVTGEGTCSGADGVGVQCISYAPNGDPVSSGGTCSGS